MANTIDKPIDKEDVRFCLQRAETQQDSLTQKLQRRMPKGKDDELARQAFIVLKEIRKIQFRYLPVTTHSLLRYNDCKFDKDGKMIRPLSKTNWYKFKKLQDIKKGKQKVLD